MTLILIKQTQPEEMGFLTTFQTEVLNQPQNFQPCQIIYTNEFQIYTTEVKKLFLHHNNFEFIYSVVLQSWLFEKI